MSSYPRIPQNDYDKARGQFRLQVGEVLSVFRFYGQNIYIPGALEEITELAEQFAMRIRGKNQPIMLESKRNSR